MRQGKLMRVKGATIMGEYLASYCELRENDN